MQELAVPMLGEKVGVCECDDERVVLGWLVTVAVGVPVPAVKDERDRDAEHVEVPDTEGVRREGDRVALRVKVKDGLLVWVVALGVGLGEPGDTEIEDSVWDAVIRPLRVGVYVRDTGGVWVRVPVTVWETGALPVAETDPEGLQVHEPLGVALARADGVSVPESEAEDGVNERADALRVGVLVSVPVGPEVGEKEALPVEEEL